MFNTFNMLIIVMINPIFIQQAYTFKYLIKKSQNLYNPIACNLLHDPTNGIRCRNLCPGCYGWCVLQILNASNFSNSGWWLLWPNSDPVPERICEIPWKCIDDTFWIPLVSHHIDMEIPRGTQGKWYLHMLGCPYLSECTGGYSSWSHLCRLAKQHQHGWTQRC